MLKILKKQKFPTILFVTASLSALALLFLIFFFARIILSDILYPAPSKQVFYLNDKLDESDPMITKKPDFKEALEGPIITDADPQAGDKNAIVTIVLFSDFKCRYCQEQEAAIGQIMDKYKNTVRLLWKDFPEVDQSSVSWQAAIAGRCAFRQGKFWQYHDLLFANMDKLDNEKFLELAKSAKLNLINFDDCMQDNLAKKQVLDNITEANALGISGIPFIYVNDQQIIGPLVFDDLEMLVDAELKKAASAE